MPGGPSKHESACDNLRQFSTQCGAETPKNLRGTKLRKQIATECRKMGYSDNDRLDLANYMGHDINIHDQYYRKTIPQQEIAKVGHILTNLTPSTSNKKSRNTAVTSTVTSSQIESSGSANLNTCVSKSKNTAASSTVTSSQIESNEIADLQTCNSTTKSNEVDDSSTSIIRPKKKTLSLLLKLLEL